MNFFTFTTATNDNRPITINMDRVDSFYPDKAAGATVFEFEGGHRVFVQESYSEVLSQIRNLK